MQQAVRIRLLECGVCLDEIQEPRALDCLHSFCLRCLRGLPGADQARLSCPHCRRVTRKQPGELEKDFRIEQVNELYCLTWLVTA
ncbi:hypothetical protein BOX15_Mlig025203g1 [Macrostomum lignano]|uniref:RING-type domain-containing protein n=1 Tax=Macrostomum lignano TaxID=282301 RepID=A0A267FBI2_9PLAT|nr:hypothetical protein BOX15_Mlig025203g1 [Macrostomum lignano]